MLARLIGSSALENQAVQRILPNPVNSIILDPMIVCSRLISLLIRSELANKIVDVIIDFLCCLLIIEVSNSFLHNHFRGYTPSNLACCRMSPTHLQSILRLFFTQKGHFFSSYLSFGVDFELTTERR